MTMSGGHMVVNMLMKQYFIYFWYIKDVYLMFITKILNHMEN